jgi:hypothetical protein
MQLAARCLRIAPAPQVRARAFVQHQQADGRQHDDVGDGDDEVDLADALQVGEQPDAAARADHAAQQQDQAHADIDVAAPELDLQRGDGVRHHLVGLAGHGDGGRNADKDQQGRGEEAAADAEHAGQQSGHAAQPQQEEDVHRLLGDG